MVFSVAAMPAMHQPVHQRTSEKQQIREDTEEVGSVLCQQEESGNG